MPPSTCWAVGTNCDHGLELRFTAKAFFEVSGLKYYSTLSNTNLNNINYVPHYVPNFGNESWSLCQEFNFYTFNRSFFPFYQNKLCSLNSVAAFNCVADFFGREKNERIEVVRNYKKV